MKRPSHSDCCKTIFPATIPPKTANFGMAICALLLLVFAISPTSAQSAEPFWIDSLEKAQLAGLRLDLVQSGGICHGEQRDLLPRLEQLDQLFDMEKAQTVLQHFSLIGIESAKLCAQIGHQQAPAQSSVELHLLERLEEEHQRRGEGGAETTKEPERNEPAAKTTTPAPPMGIDEQLLSPEGRASLQLMLAHPEGGDTELDQMLRRMEAMARQGGVKPLPSGVLESQLNRSGYDPRSAPSFVPGRPVEVRVGVLVQSIANFQLATMDYDMDCWLRMSWRDPRLALNLSTPILINDELFLKKIWRPDVHFVNARDALFHRVTRLNFYAFVFPRGGEVFLEARLYVKPKSQLVLCKYPHDSQTLQLRISSIASTNGSVRFLWFSRPSDAIRVHGKLQLPELYIAGMENRNCQSQRKTGNFSCLEARFLMKRSIGYHLWQTYVPTATCVLFSWISVWLPEEFVEGRVFVALTVFLTLSAESSSAKETLPKVHTNIISQVCLPFSVSYVKAIDVWFGFTAVFVFCTMLQALLVIGLEHRSQQLKKMVIEQAGQISAYKATLLFLDSRRFHRIARGLDTFFKVMYPVIFTIFLFIYIFVVIEGDEHKCLQSERQLTQPAYEHDL